MILDDNNNLQLEMIKMEKHLIEFICNESQEAERLRMFFSCFKFKEEVKESDEEILNRIIKTRRYKRAKNNILICEGKEIKEGSKEYEVINERIKDLLVRELSREKLMILDKVNKDKSSKINICRIKQFIMRLNKIKFSEVLDSIYKLSKVVEVMIKLFENFIKRSNSSFMKLLFL